MNDTLHSTIEQLLKNRPRYVKDAVTDTAVRDQQMSDNGNDSLYQESARRLRRIEHKLENDEVDRDDHHKIVDAVLRFELHRATDDH